MARFGNVHRITLSVGGREITFRSKLEYRYCVYLQLLKEQGLIQDWWYEDPDSLLELVQQYENNIKRYLPDFTVLTNEGHYEYHETKGWFPAKDYTKLKLTSEQYENEIVLIFANLNNTRSQRAQYNRAKRLEDGKFVKRVIWNAKRDIFRKIKHLFEV